MSTPRPRRSTATAALDEPPATPRTPPSAPLLFCGLPLQPRFLLLSGSILVLHTLVTVLEGACGRRLDASWSTARGNRHASELASAARSYIHASVQRRVYVRNPGVSPGHLSLVRDDGAECVRVNTSGSCSHTLTCTSHP